MRRTDSASIVLLLLLATLTSLVLPPASAAAQMSWVPQGRFGKRTESLEDIKAALAGVQETDNVRNILLSNGRMKFADDPYIRGDGVICIKTAHIGFYRCLRRIVSEVIEVADPET